MVARLPSLVRKRGPVQIPLATYNRHRSFEPFGNLRSSFRDVRQRLAEQILAYHLFESSRQHQRHVFDFVVHSFFPLFQHLAQVHSYYFFSS